MNFIWEAVTILFIGFCLLRIAGKKTVSEMTGLEIITLLSIASVIGHAVSENGFWETFVTLCVFIALLVTIQYLSLKYNLIEKLFMGKATLVIRDGRIISKNLRKLRMSVDQLEARLRENAISSFSDVKSATIEMSGQLGYELVRDAKPVTVGELELILANLGLIQQPSGQSGQQKDNLFREPMNQDHLNEVPPK